jgi:hypothetical protein
MSLTDVTSHDSKRVSFATKQTQKRFAGGTRAPEKEKKGHGGVVGDFAGEEEGRSVAQHHGQNGHEGEGTDGAREYYMRAALHGEERRDKKRLVADFADKDCSKALQKGVCGGGIPAAAGQPVRREVQGDMNTSWGDCTAHTAYYRASG